METHAIRAERIDIRITPEEKRIFLRARKLSGDRSLSSFVTRIVKAKAIEIIDENEQILASKKDRKIFFDAIFAEIEPNNALKNAAKKFKSIKE
jgi:uncharacterized protein (DUF1778 family)